MSENSDIFLDLDEENDEKKEKMRIIDSQEELIIIQSLMNKLVKNGEKIPNLNSLSKFKEIEEEIVEISKHLHSKIQRMYYYLDNTNNPKGKIILEKLKLIQKEYQKEINKLVNLLLEKKQNLPAKKESIFSNSKLKFILVGLGLTGIGALIGGPLVGFVTPLLLDVTTTGAIILGAGLGGGAGLTTAVASNMAMDGTKKIKSKINEKKEMIKIFDKEENFEICDEETNEYARVVVINEDGSISEEKDPLQEEKGEEVIVIGDEKEEKGEEKEEGENMENEKEEEIEWEKKKGTTTNEKKSTWFFDWFKGLRKEKVNEEKTLNTENKKLIEETSKNESKKLENVKENVELKKIESSGENIEIKEKNGFKIEEENKIINIAIDQNQKEKGEEIGNKKESNWLYSWFTNLKGDSFKDPKKEKNKEIGKKDKEKKENPTSVNEIHEKIIEESKTVESSKENSIIQNNDLNDKKIEENTEEIDEKNKENTNNEISIVQNEKKETKNEINLKNEKNEKIEQEKPDKSSKKDSSTWNNLFSLFQLKSKESKENTTNMNEIQEEIESKNAKSTKENSIIQNKDLNDEKVEENAEKIDEKSKEKSKNEISIVQNEKKESKNEINIKNEKNERINEKNKEKANNEISIVKNEKKETENEENLKNEKNEKIEKEKQDNSSKKDSSTWNNLFSLFQPKSNLKVKEKTNNKESEEKK